MDPSKITTYHAESIGNHEKHKTPVPASRGAV
jgi:hypothetical protein